MKRIAAIAVLTAAALMATGSAMAQNQSVKVNVPFEFSVSNSILPAGSYTIGADVAHPTTFVVRDSKGKVLAMELGLSDTSDKGKLGTLVFHKIGEQYFLSEIRFASPSSSIFFPATKAELRARKHAKREIYTSVSTS